MKTSIWQALRITLILSITISAILFVPSQSAQAASGVLYAAPNGLTNGACDSWANACTLEYALGTVAASGDEIWVMQGVHYPTTSTDRTISFQLITGVGVYGGFDGTETSLDQRNPATNLTTLSGDIGTIGIHTDNSYHVVVGSGTIASAVLDGFTITGGYADGVGRQLDGGGMLNDTGSPTLINVTFSGNMATSGGGMENYNNSHPTLSNVTFRDNTASDYGGGLLNYRSNPTLTNVIFSGNAADNGGGLYNYQSSPSLTDVTFSGNTTTRENGGGLYNYQSSPSLTDMIFNGNTAENGGGMYNYYDSSPSLTNVTFSGNTAVLAGGGMYNWRSNTSLTDVTFSGNTADVGGGISSNTSSPILKNVTFSDNMADVGGGGMYNYYNSSPSLTNVTFSGNTATSYGGGIYNYYDSSTGLTNVTFSGNTADVGGGIYIERSSSTLDNVILWGNSASSSPEIYNDATSLTSVANSVVAGSGGSGASWDIALGTDGGGNLDADPLLQPLANNGGFTETMALGVGSAAINAGNDAACPTTDQRGVNRSLYAPCDIGAYEFGADTLTMTASTPIIGTSLSSLSIIEITYSEEAASGGGAKAADNTANYLLVEAGANGVFDTASCLGGVQTDDAVIALSAAVYDSSTLTTTLTLATPLASPADDGSYRLFVCGTTSVWSVAGLKLNNGVSDITVDFTITTATAAGGGDTLPATGFAPGVVTELPAQPAEKAYTDSDLLLSIPNLDVEMEIVGVPLSDGEWDTSWLGQSAGWLEGSAFPTWEGNTILTGHVWDANNNLGPFADLKDLQYGDTIEIVAFGQTYVYEVRESTIVFPGKVDKVFQHEEYDYLTLLTCEMYNPLSGNYIFRRVVRAVLVEVE